MNVLMITCFADKNITSRSNFIYEYFINNNYDCHLIYSEFQHEKKAKLKVDDPNWIPIRTISYSKNISIRRLLSHAIFSVKAVEQINKFKPDLVYLAIPPNSVAKFAFKKAKKINSKIIIDVIDLWPESFPALNRLSKVLALPINIWKSFRDNYINKADVLLLECNLYKKYLYNKLNNPNIHVLYLAKNYIQRTEQDYNCHVNHSLNICYLGSINQLINLDLVVKLLSELSKSANVIFHIIGKGDRKEHFLSELDKAKINYQYYGAVYDDEEKNRIMSFCDFGINLYKDNTIIGLTYKSIDYLSSGLPLINSIKGDTWNFVEDKGIGFNCNIDNLDELVNCILATTDNNILEMKRKAYDLYINTFEKSVVEQKFKKILDIIESGE